MFQIKLVWDTTSSTSELHADGEPAIEFADGYKLYSCHGVTLPEKWYVSLPSHQLRKAWQMSKGNISLRRTD